MLTDQMDTAHQDEKKACEDFTKQTGEPDINPGKLLNAVNILPESYRSTETSVIWNDAEDDKERIKRLLGIDVSEQFFYLGGLKKEVRLFHLQDIALKGTEVEKQKYNMLHDLSYKLLTLDVRENYPKSFDGMYFIPLAIQNSSSVQDVNITVLVYLEIGKIVEPDEHLIWPDYEGLQGVLCRDDENDEDVGVICELFGMMEDGFIHVEDTMYALPQHLSETSTMSNQDLFQYRKTEKDYKQELKEYIASSGGKNYYEFNIESLRPGECKWFCQGMLIRPINNEVKMNYHIYSKYSTGDLTGTLNLNMD